MDSTSLADRRHETTTRTERALRLFEEFGNHITRVVDDLYMVPSADGARWYEVLYGGSEERCNCPAYQYGDGRACKHLLAVGIKHASRRSGVREVRAVRVAAGDGIAYRAKKSYHCYGGWVYLGVEEDGAEHLEPVPCRRCSETR